MQILIQTSNPRKIDEYRRHFALYGIVKSVETVPYDEDDAESVAWLKAARPKSFVLSEQSDLFHRDGTVVKRPYRTHDNDGTEVSNASTARVLFLNEDGTVGETRYHRSIPGRLRIVDETDDVFDWDDVFVPEQSSRSYHEAKAGPGKMSARSLVLDAVVRDFVPFRSSRAFKYGRLNADGMVDLNHWPVEPSSAIQFDTLPWDFLADGPLSDMPALEDFGIASMLRSALSDGAHFRAARSRREWIYWAPGINAGIPLTPKEDPSAELVYLVHDFAHYLLPDLVVDVPSSPAVDTALVVHRMIGETMAMVFADMFFMSALLRSGRVADADKHGIHAIYAMADLSGVPADQVFFAVLRAAAGGLLLGDAEALYALVGRSDEAVRAVERFMAKYRRFALADYEWTHLNLLQQRSNLSRTLRWIGMMPEGHLEATGLDTASAFLARTGIGPDTDASPAEILRIALDDVVARNLAPRMRSVPVDRDEVLSRTLARYFTGQLALHARYDEFEGRLPGRDAIVAALEADGLDLGDAATVRAAVEEDLAILEKAHAITPFDREIYASVYPVVDARYVSYASPNFGTYDEAFATISGNHA